MTDFKLIKPGVDVRPLISALSRCPHLWSEITARQDLPGSPHVDTETIYLRWAQDKSVEAAFTELEAIDYPALDLMPEFRPVLADVMKEVGGKTLGRAIVAKLKPNGLITEHSDEGQYADHYERFHLCLESDEGNQFFVDYNHPGSEVVHMKPGELWWFNHKRPHLVFNPTSTPRIHLIIDAVAPEYKRERHALSA